MMSSFCVFSEILFFVNGMFVVSKPFSPFSGKINLKIVKRVSFPVNRRLLKSHSSGRFLEKCMETVNYWRTPQKNELTPCYKDELDSLKTIHIRTPYEKFCFRKVLEKMISQIPKKIKEIQNSEPMKVENDFHQAMIDLAGVKMNKNSTLTQIREADEKYRKTRLLTELYSESIGWCRYEMRRLFKLNERFRKMHCETFF